METAINGCSGAPHYGIVDADVVDADVGDADVGDAVTVASSHDDGDN